MRFNKLDLNLLVALDAMLSLRNVSRAAEKLNLSQSAMSNALSRLRDYFDDELLVQVGRGMDLTPRARILQDSVRDVLVRVDSAISARPVFDPLTSDRVFRIFCSDFSAFTIIPHLLAIAADMKATVGFDLLPQVDQPDKALERGEADLLLIPRDYCSPSHPSETLFSETFSCIVWSGSPLANISMTPDIFSSAGHVVTRPHNSARSIESTLLDQLGIHRNIEVNIFSFAALPHLVVGTDRIATVHTRLALQAQAYLPLTLHKTPFELPLMEQTMQWHQYRTLDPGLAWLRSMLGRARLAMDEKLLGKTVP